MGRANKVKTALITGVTGQDGSLLAEFLLGKKYRVHGIKRRSSIFNTARIEHLIPNPNFAFHYGDMADTANLIQLISKTQPDEIYNLAALSHVKVSFDLPEYTANVDALGPLRLLEAIRILGLEQKVRFYQASSSEIFGASPPPQSEETPFQPRSPYAAAKLYAHWITANYRDAYGIHASNGILFNHESHLRGETFVTRKITRAVAAIKHGSDMVLRLGNLEAKRDWGHASDYIRAMWLMLQQEQPDDYVIATGESHSVREFVELAFAEIGVALRWEQREGREAAIGADGRLYVQQDDTYKRPLEVDYLRGDAAKARRVLGWSPSVSFGDMVRDLVARDIAALGAN